MVDIKYANAYQEVLEILKYIPQEDYNKVPKDEIELLEANANRNYVFAYNPDQTLEEQGVSKIARGVIAIFFRDYWATEEQREKILAKQKQDRQIVEEEKRKKYNPEDIFANKKRTEKVEENALTEVKKEKWYTKVVSFFQRLFQKKGTNPVIKNIVFDLGGVLIDFKPEKYLRHIEFSEEDVVRFKQIVFWGEEWGEYNSSDLTIKETEQKLVEHYPEYREKIQEIFAKMDFSYILFEIKETAEYLKELSEKGYQIYLLSDLSRDCYEYNKHFPLFQYVKGGVYSFEIGSTKPNEKNYKTILEKYHLRPQETIFIDDRLNNVEAANNFGIHGIQFISLEQVKEEVEKYLV